LDHASKRQKASLWSLIKDPLLARAGEIANFGTWDHNLKSRKLVVSNHLESLLDLSPGATLSVKQYWSKVHPSDVDRVKAGVDKAMAAGDPFQYVCRYRMPDGTIKHLSTIGLTFLDTAGKPVRTVGIIQDVTDQTRAGDDLHRVTQQLIRARDEERRHMARELHESAGQTLAALKMSLGQLRDCLPEADLESRDVLATALGFAEDAVREVRTVSYLMHPPMLDEAGLASALRWYAKGFGERSGISMDVQVPEEFRRMPQEVETTLFRIVQEALTNVHRYSGSRTARIRLSQQNGSVFAEVHDDGCGLPLPNRTTGTAQPLGVGIAGMRERVNQLNGTFEITSSPGRGTTVRAELPVEKGGVTSNLGSRWREDG
jgi:two-component system NarL family sensor kinase